MFRITIITRMTLRLKVRSSALLWNCSLSTGNTCQLNWNKKNSKTPKHHPHLHQGSLFWCWLLGHKPHSDWPAAKKKKNQSSSSGSLIPRQQIDCFLCLYTVAGVCRHLLSFSGNPSNSEVKQHLDDSRGERERESGPSSSSDALDLVRDVLIIIKHAWHLCWWVSAAEWAILSL